MNRPYTLGAQGETLIDQATRQTGQPKLSELVLRQAKFLLALTDLIKFATACGFKITGGELERTAEQAKLNARKGIGIANSLHCSRRAGDLNFYLPTGELVADKVRLEKIGKFWESLGGTWGGRFTKYDDSRHFEM